MWIRIRSNRVENHFHHDFDRLSADCGTQEGLPDGCEPPGANGRGPSPAADAAHVLPSGAGLPADCGKGKHKGAGKSEVRFVYKLTLWLSEPAVLFLAALSALDKHATWTSKWWSEAAFSRPVGEFHQAAEVEEADEGEWNDVPTGATSGEEFVAPRGTGDQ